MREAISFRKCALQTVTHKLISMKLIWKIKIPLKVFWCNPRCLKAFHKEPSMWPPSVTRLINEERCTWVHSGAIPRILCIYHSFGWWKKGERTSWPCYFINFHEFIPRKTTKQGPYFIKGKIVIVSIFLFLSSISSSSYYFGR